MTDRASCYLPRIVPELAQFEQRAKTLPVQQHTAPRRFPSSFSSRLCSLLGKPRAELTQDERKELAPELMAVCRQSFAECGRIADRDRRTMHDYCNAELRGKAMPNEVIDALEDYAVWRAFNDRFARSA